MGRLNDTKAISSRPLHEGNTSCPDHGEAVVHRMRPKRGEREDWWDEDKKEFVPHVPRPQTDAGSESLRGAVMYLGKKLGKG